MHGSSRACARSLTGFSVCISGILNKCCAVAYVDWTRARDFSAILLKIYTEVRKCPMVFVEALSRIMWRNPIAWKLAHKSGQFLTQSCLEFISIWEAFFYLIIENNYNRNVDTISYFRSNKSHCILIVSVIINFIIYITNLSEFLISFKFRRNSLKYRYCSFMASYTPRADSTLIHYVAVEWIRADASLSRDSRRLVSITGFKRVESSIKRTRPVYRAQNSERIANRVKRLRQKLEECALE